MVHLDEEKKLNVYANYKLQEKTASHDMQICVSENNYFYQLIDSSQFISA